MKGIKKIEKDTILESVSDRIKMVAPSDIWIVTNENGTFFKHPEMGYMMNKSKSICQIYADAENK